ncbi:hypothetical protein [Aeropyrum globular virus 1]|uniref:hypothetical protein n=1 Tax=Aeropyrum globular virus 1 TaxID=1932713 RepID=UPI000C7EF34C|nr:hypothetical protein C1186_gp11 [Aeropyrum globular virus 1]BBC20937.1 hypothetical protein [Aeropyrum globular virus 1]
MVDYPGWLYPAAWLAAILASALILALVYWKTESIRTGLIVSLLWMKAAALVLWLVGLDRPVVKLLFIRSGDIAWGLTLTANMLVVVALAVTNLTIYAWPELSRELLGRREGLPGVLGRG